MNKEKLKSFMKEAFLQFSSIMLIYLPFAIAEHYLKNDLTPFAMYAALKGFGPLKAKLAQLPGLRG